MNSRTQPTSVLSPTPSKKTTGNPTIIIIIVAVVLALTVGGYFGWRYISKNYLKSKADTATTPTSTVFTLTKLEEMIKYPNGTLTSTDRSKTSGYTSILQMETDDSVTTANSYYLSLNSDKKWAVVSKSLESDSSRADITYEGTKDKFTVAFVIDHNYEKTEILVRIDAENLSVGTPLGTNSSTPSLTTTPATPTTTSQTGVTPTINYIIADSNIRVISESELVSLTPWQLKVARNEIYARHGRAFVHKDLQCYFKTQNWYEINSNFSESSLSVIENKNVATIQAYEQKINSPLQNSDSGCKS